MAKFKAKHEWKFGAQFTVNMLCHVRFYVGAWTLEGPELTLPWQFFFDRLLYLKIWIWKLNLGSNQVASANSAVLCVSFKGLVVFYGSASNSKTTWKTLQGLFEK